MDEEQTNSVSQVPANKLLRPALIVSERIVSEYSIFLHHLMVGLADESIPAALVCPPGCDVDSVTVPAVEVIRHPTFDLPLMGYQNKKILIDRLKKFKPAVLHCLCESKAALTRQLAGRLDLPYVLTVNSLRKRWWRFLISSKRCAKVIVPTESIAANISGIYPAIADRVELINPGTFVQETSGCFCRGNLLATIVTTHPLEDVSEFENLLAAVKHLAIEGYEFMLVVAGGGRAERQLRKLLTARGLLQMVITVGQLRPRRSILAAGDIFIQPVASAAFNPLLLEAMSVGTAVAACKGGVDDMIIDGRTAVIFDPADQLSIKAALQKLLDSRDFARRLAEGARQYVRENHTVSGMVSAVLGAYRDAQNQLKS
jgi:glycosyltransferase involved in cell wall biosynthesis